MFFCVRTLAIIFSVGVLILSFPNFVVATHTENEFPKRANYYLGELSDADAFIRDISRYDLLILTPAQIKSHPAAIKKIRSLHKDITILGYVPSQSYNLRYWNSDPVFKNFKNLPDSVWLLNSKGSPIVDSFDVKWANMSAPWSDALLDFTRKNILTLDVDGIFFDMVSHNISWLNGGDIDFNRDKKRDEATSADKMWLDRTTEFLKKASDTLDTKYIVINGSSHTSFQKSVNGRMFETFPTPWEGDGSWETVLNNAKGIKKSNKFPQLLVFNGNSNNTGVQNNYKSFRFGFVSSLFEEAYFSYDFGDQAHSQLWWYDEYGSNLGQPLGPAAAHPTLSNTKNNNKYAPGVWMRSFENGVALINSTDKKQRVDLGGEYEKFHGKQDPTVNDGAIVTETEVDTKDGIILLRTFATLQDALYTNGDFVRFFRPEGTRVRNGFFVFEEKYKGGDQVAQVDIDGNTRRDLIVVSKNKITIWRDDGQLFSKFYPYGPSYAGKIRLAFGDLTDAKGMEIVVAPSDGYALPVQVYTRFGNKLTDNWFPFGKQYKGGYSVGVIGGDDEGKIVIGSGSGKESVVQIYDPEVKLMKEWFAFEKYFKGGANVAVGDVDGDGVEEIVVGSGKGKKPLIKVYDQAGELKYKEFSAYSSLGTPGIDVRVVDVDFDGKDDIIGMSESF